MRSRLILAGLLLPTAFVVGAEPAKLTGAKKPARLTGATPAPAMLRIRAFQGLSPAPQLAAEVACVPYDVVNREESAALAEGKPNSLLHVHRH